MLNDALEEAQVIREAQIARSIIEADFDMGILNIGLGHIETGRIEKWLREMGVETESDPKTNKLKYEMKELFEKNKRKEGELEKLRREFYQDLI
jgi:glycine cleavage system aminomethyltransferase T